MRDEEARRAPVNLDWGASAWSLSNVFYAFLRRDFDLAGRSRDIITALNDDDSFENEEPLIVSTHKKLRDVIKRGNITVHMKTELHPAVWLRLLHFIGESTGLRFKAMEDSYCEWRESNHNVTPIVRRQTPGTTKGRSWAMDVFLLQDIDELNLKKNYKWSKPSATSLTSKDAEKTNQSKPSKHKSKATLNKRIEKIGKDVCRNVEGMLASSIIQHIPNLSPMRANARSKSAQGETRHYQYQGAALALAQHLKRQSDSPVSRRSDEVVAKAVRLYVKCS
jgi:hypothetical protein